MDQLQKKRILTKKSELLKIIAHPMRLCILSCLIDESCNVTYLVEKMNIPQSTISQHLSKLRMAGLIVGERNGVEITYSISNTEIISLIGLLLQDSEELELITENIN